MDANLRKGLSWLAGTFILLLIVAYFMNKWPFDKGNGVGAKATTEVVSTDNANSSSSLSAKDCEIASLKEKLAEREGQLDQANMTIAQLIADCGGKKTVTYTKPAAPKNTGGSGKTGGVPITRQVAPAKSEAEYGVESTSVPRANFTAQKNEIPMCVQIGTRFWPHLAMNEGETFPEAISNGPDQGGYNLSLMPKGTLETIDPNQDYGITEDRVCWVRASRIAKWSEGQTVKIMVTTGNFKNAELYNGLLVAQ